jgi:hypothetical protein
MARAVKYALEQGFEEGTLDATATATRHVEMELLEKESTIESLRQELLAVPPPRDSPPRAAAAMDACVGTDDMLWEEPDAASEVRGDESDEALRRALRERDDRNAALEEEVAALRSRLDTLRGVYDERMDDLKASTDQAVGAMTRQVSESRETAERETRHKEALVAECDKNRDLLRTAQERALEVHKSMLEELRRRDAEGRLLHEEKRKEWSEMNVRLQLSENENRGMKRHLDEMREETADAKRLRLAMRQTEIEKTKAEAEASHLRIQLDTYRQEVIALRRKNADLESQVAVLEATSKLESCRRDLVK